MLSSHEPADTFESRGASRCCISTLLASTWLALMRADARSLAFLHLFRRHWCGQRLDSPESLHVCCFGASTGTCLLAQSPLLLAFAPSANPRNPCIGSLCLASGAGNELLKEGGEWVLCVRSFSPNTSSSCVFSVKAGFFSREGSVDCQACGAGIFSGERASGRADSRPAGWGASRGR